MQVWAEPFTKLRLSKIFNLFQDPFERADITSNTYWDWQINHVGSIYGAMDEVFAFLATFKRLPAALVPTELRADDDREQTIDDMKDAMKRKSSGSRALQ